MLEDSYTWKDTFYIKMYITVEPRYNKLFFNPRNSIMVNKWQSGEKEARYKLTNLVITNIFCQSLGPLLYRGSTVLNLISLFFNKWRKREKCFCLISSRHQFVNCL